ncbi:hypothetical protein DSECCO2_490230 [anaerobic digester metagenome]
MELAGREFREGLSCLRTAGDHFPDHISDAVQIHHRAFRQLGGRGSLDRGTGAVHLHLDKLSRALRRDQEAQFDPHRHHLRPDPGPLAERELDRGRHFFPDPHADHLLVRLDPDRTPDGIPAAHHRPADTLHRPVPGPAPGLRPHGPAPVAESRCPDAALRSA